MTESFRLDNVPSEDDLDKIERELERRQTGDEEEVVDGYTEPELLQYGVAKERFSRKSISDYNDFGLEGKAVQGISTAGAGALVAMFGGDWQSAYLAGLATYAGSEIAIRKGLQNSENPARDQKLEEAFQEYSSNL